MNHHQRCPSQKKLLEERLEKGKAAATQLQTLLQHKLSNNINHGSVVVPDVQMLALQILRSFTDSLSFLGPNNEILSSHQIVSADAPTTDCSTDRSSKTTAAAAAAAAQRKKIKTTRSGGVKDRRGSYKRRYTIITSCNLFIYYLQIVNSFSFY